MAKWLKNITAMEFSFKILVFLVAEVFIMNLMPCKYANSQEVWVGDWIFGSREVPLQLRSVFFTCSDTGYAVGFSSISTDGIIAKSTDGGHSWFLVMEPPSTPRLISVFFNTKNTGWAVGPSGVILKTHDEGNNWSQVASGRTEDFSCIYFTDEFTGFIAGANGTLLKTTDGGANWSLQSVETSSFLNNITFPTSQTGFICWAGIILKTNDGGISWSRLSFEGENFFGISHIHFSDVNTGYAIVHTMYNSYLMKTTDGGINWAVLPSTFSEIYAYQDIHFLNNNTGYLIGSYGKFLKTTDGGENWEQITNFTEGESLFSIFFIDNQTGIVVGNHTFYMWTTNGGLSSLPNTITEASLIRTYPNPVTGKLKIEFDNPTGHSSSLNILSITGQKLFNTSFEEQHLIEIDLGFLQNGIYLITVKRQGNTITSKINIHKLD